MSLFGLGKKKDEVKEVNSNCGCSEACATGTCDTQPIENVKPDIVSGESVKVLGSGCAKCNELEANVKKALEQLSMDTSIEHVTDFAQIAAYGVMSTPALVVDGKVVAYGKVLKVEEVVKLLEKVR
ncbi:thioredoxin family protein [[Clostridium] fimetarium]|uniref:Small redox-active disulfide protein 2 n=1 Tax=[Clostridium] fimetarium TaxID=99656 RepID=A0A1I0PV95_9FIRM|nr:thioredoxin family protein [[Clostridium] fimetarium]SEW18251.1 small redox-active disulfide protein 2 [[Clostridium] fimetarium]